jgi:hypothetical protein
MARIFKEGETIWVVNRWRRDVGRPETVTKVGRLYLHTSGGHKANLGTLRDGLAMDDNYMFFPSQAAHRRYMEATYAQVALMDRMKRERLTMEQTQAINELLGWTP